MESRGQSRFVTRALVAQAGLIALASAAMLAPPARGSIAILPALPGDTAATLRWAIDAGALPMALGPYPGSIVVRGSRAALLIPALSHGALLITARYTDCGSTPSGDIA